MLLLALIVEPTLAATYVFKARNCQRPDTSAVVVKRMTASFVPLSCMELALVRPDAPVKASALAITKTATAGCRLEKVSVEAGAAKPWLWTSRKAAEGDAHFYVDCLLQRVVRHFPPAVVPDKAKKRTLDD